MSTMHKMYKHAYKPRHEKIKKYINTSHECSSQNMPFKCDKKILKQKIKTSDIFLSDCIEKGESG